MLSKKYLLLFLKEKYKIFLALIFVNLLITTSGLLYWEFTKGFVASIKVVFNEIKLDFQGNKSNNYLFESNNPFEFVNLLESDVLLDTLVKKYDYASILGISKANENRDKIARQILRTKTKISIEKHSLKISLIEEDEVLAENLLLSMVELVEKININRIRQNNTITKQIAEEYLKDIDSSLKPFRNELINIIGKADSSMLGRGFLEISQLYGQSVSQKVSIINTINEIERLEKLPKYKPYFIINQGVKSQDLETLTIILLLGLANAIAFVFEFQLLFLFKYLKDTVAKLKEME